MKGKNKIRVLASAIALIAGVSANVFGDQNTTSASAANQPWMNKKLSADQRTDLVIKEMTQEEKIKLVFGYFGTDAVWRNMKRPEPSYAQSAGFVFGIPRLSIPHLWQSDAGVGVASQIGPNPRLATALPSGINTAATWDVKVAFDGGAMIGSEARAYGFNVLLAGGVNLMREPRNGRNFEYAGDDPLLGGQIVGAQIRGIQSNQIVSTLKHYAFNDQETGRNTLDARIDDQSARMSDLLAFQIANEQGQPGSVMCSYNRVNGYYACESEYLLNEVLKKDWGFKGWVMSDWGATHSTVPAANNGLDQQSGYPFDKSDYFNGALVEAVNNGWVKHERLDDMVHRVLYPMFALGLVDNPVSSKPETINVAANELASQKDSEAGIVLLKNDAQLLPINTSVKKIAVIGGNANKGVIAGGGSSTVYGRGGNPMKDLEPKFWPGPVTYYPSAPSEKLQAHLPNTSVVFDDGKNIAAATELAAKSDLVIVFGVQWNGESFDAPNLSLQDNQDELISKIAAANKKTVVVLENGGPLTMPWLDKVGAVVEAWYPGSSGGEAIARVLTGAVNPSGHLPATFPASESQLPRPVLDGYPEERDKRFNVTYSEGAAVGYKWFDLKNLKPLFPFGYGLSYTQFAYDGLKASEKFGIVTVSFNAKNTGKVLGKTVPQVYVSAPNNIQWEAPKRLGAFTKLEIKPGSSTAVKLTIDPRLLAVYDSANKTWNIQEGDYKVQLAQDAMDTNAVSVTVHVKATTLDVRGNMLSR